MTVVYVYGFFVRFVLFLRVRNRLWLGEPLGCQWTSERTHSPTRIHTRTDTRAHIHTNKYTRIRGGKEEWERKMQREREVWCCEGRGGEQKGRNGWRWGRSSMMKGGDGDQIEGWSEGKGGIGMRWEGWVTGEES